MAIIRNNQLLCNKLAFGIPIPYKQVVFNACHYALMENKARLSSFEDFHIIRQITPKVFKLFHRNKPKN